MDVENDSVTDSRELKSILLMERPTLLVTAGAGDIYKLIPQIKSILT